MLGQRIAFLDPRRNRKSVEERYVVIRPSRADAGWLFHLYLYRIPVSQETVIFVYLPVVTSNGSALQYGRTFAAAADRMA